MLIGSCVRVKAHRSARQDAGDVPGGRSSIGVGVKKEWAERRGAFVGRCVARCVRVLTLAGREGPRRSIMGERGQLRHTWPS